MNVRIKPISVILMWGISLTAYRMFSPVLTNDIALTQLENSSTSFAYRKLYQDSGFLVWLALIIITVFIYRSNIKKLYYKIKSK